MEEFSDDPNEEIDNPIMKPKTRTPAQIASFKKAQSVRLENAKDKKEKMENIKETIKINRLSVEEKEESGLGKLQRERDEIEKKILSQAKILQEKKLTDIAMKQIRKDELRAQEKIKEQTFNKTKKEPKIIYQDATDSEEEVVIVKKKKKQPKVVYESESEEEQSKPKPKSKPDVTVSAQIIKTNQIRFF
jgi:hypothetical protein